MGRPKETLRKFQHDEHWAQTIAFVTPECEPRVTRTVQLWNQKVRNQLAGELAFQLNRRHVPVRVHDGLPIPLWDILGGKALRKIREDVLGAYFVRQREVRVYWQAIGVFAALYEVEVEPLTVVVLAHELAHAYTHLGFDIDGFDWPTKRFVSTDIAIVEGLAQFYAEVVCKNLEAQIPEAITAFRVLLTEQNEVYRTHRAWVDEDDRNSGEIVRVSLLECRRSGRTMHRKDFAETVARRRHEIAGA